MLAQSLAFTSAQTLTRLLVVGSLLVAMTVFNVPRINAQEDAPADSSQPATAAAIPAEPDVQARMRVYMSDLQYDIPGLPDDLATLHETVLAHVDTNEVAQAESTLTALKLDDRTPSWQIAAMLTNRAVLQIVLQRPEDAAASFTSALDTMEAAGEIAHPLLVMLLTIQGDMQRTAGAFDFATNSYQLAQSVDHKLNGVDSLTQLPLLHKLSATKLAEVHTFQKVGKFTGTGQYAVMREADSFQQQALRISEKNHGKSSEAHTNRIMETAHYYMGRATSMVLDHQSSAMDLPLYVDNSGCNDGGGDYQDGETIEFETRDAIRGPPQGSRGSPTSCVPAHVALKDVIQYQEYQKFLERHKVDLYREASRLYKQSIDIISDIHGPDDIRLFEPYQHLSRAMYLRGKRASGLRHLNRSLDTIVNDLGTDRLDKINALVNAGDFFNRRQSPRARTYYMRALAIIDTQLDANQLRDQFFGQPIVIRANMRTIRLINPPKDASPYLTATYRVTRTGEVDQVRFPEGNVRFAARQQVKKYLQRTRYRPSVENGKLVDTSGMTHQATFITNSQLAKNVASRVSS